VRSDFRPLAGADLVKNQGMNLDGVARDGCPLEHPTAARATFIMALTSADDLYFFVGLHVARYRHKPWRDHSGDKLAEKCIKRPAPPAQDNGRVTGVEADKKGRPEPLRAHFVRLGISIA
jgi:hypothetical protein